ncbi:MAG: sigma-70 family RNA polymerase sigma factor [Lachnospiraceae bacterium]|nr:sigma-70 family RNA polymerase sigma factor [Lachnospiraceae bacterium]
MDELYQQYARTVYRYLKSVTHNEDVAEELTQETFYRAIRSIDRFDGSCKVSTWLCAIAKNLYLSYLRIFGGLSFAEAAELLGKSENLARVTFYRGKEKLRKDRFEMAAFMRCLKRMAVSLKEFAAGR